MCEATIKQLIYDALSHAGSKGMTITDIRNSNSLLTTLSIQKITYILNIAPFLYVNNICYGIYWYKKRFMVLIQSRGKNGDAVISTQKNKKTFANHLTSTPKYDIIYTTKDGNLKQPIGKERNYVRYPDEDDR